MNLINRVIRPEDFDNFYSAKDAKHEADKAQKQMEQEKLAALSFPYIHEIYSLIYQAAKHGKYLLDYDFRTRLEFNIEEYIEEFICYSGYKVEKSKGENKIGCTLTISWISVQNTM